MFSVLLSASLATIMASGQPKLEAGTRLYYQGSVSLKADEAGTKSRKSFDLTLWVSRSMKRGVELYWVLDERGHGGWPWSERFGRLMLDRHLNGGMRGPSLLYERNDGRSVIPILLPIWSNQKKLKADARWEEDKTEYSVERAAKEADREVWQVAVRNGYGLKRMLGVDQHGPLITSLIEKVTMDKGNEYQLKMELVSAEKIPPDKFAPLSQAFVALLNMRNKISQPLDSQEVVWKPTQLALLRSELPKIEELASKTVLEELVASAKRDVELQAGRSDALGDLARQHTGKPLPEFTLAEIDGGSVTSKDLAGKVTVLHFWEYRAEPLKEPYGQVGYLDFLYQRRKDSGVQVYGVAVDGRLTDEMGKATAVRSVKKLKDFMNLSYPVLLDDGNVLKKFGDPRLVGAALPLFVVIGPDGKILEYHVGHYEVRQDQGLTQLDQTVTTARK